MEPSEDELLRFIVFTEDGVNDILNFVQVERRKALDSMGLNSENGIPSFSRIHHLIRFMVTLRATMKGLFSPLIQHLDTCKEKGEVWSAKLLRGYLSAYASEGTRIAHSLKVSDTISQKMIQEVYRNLSRMDRHIFQSDLVLAGSPSLQQQSSLVRGFLKNSEGLSRQLQELNHLSILTAEREGAAKPASNRNPTPQPAWSEWMSKGDVQRALKRGVFRTLKRNSGNPGWPIIEEHPTNNKLARYQLPDKEVD
jgi:hypothetical protein